MKSTALHPPKASEFACVQAISHDAWLKHKTMEDYLISARGVVSLIERQTLELLLADVAICRYLKYALHKRS